MPFLNDLDAMAWAAAVVAMLVFLCSTFLSYQDYRNECRVEVAKRVALLWMPVLLLLIGALTSYSSKVNAPRKSVEGVARYVGESHSRSFDGIFLCATSCQLTGGYSLALYGRGARAVKMGSDYRFNYLEHPIGSTYTGTWLQVITVADPESGRIVYALDISNHPYRVIAYLLDAMLMVMAVLFAWWLRGRQRGRRGEEQDSSDEEEETSGGRLDKIIPI